MSEKEWPKNKSESVNFAEIAEPLLKAAKQLITARNKNDGKDLEWTGLPLGISERATCISPAEYMKAKTRDWANNNTLQSNLEIIVQLAIQLGIEQGRRIQCKEVEQFVKYGLKPERILNIILEDEKL